MSMLREAALIQKLGHANRTGDGELRFNCPFCERAGKSKDRKGHLYVTFRRKGTRDDGRPIGLGYICHRCSTKGSIKSLFGRLGLTYVEPVRNLREAVTARLQPRQADTRPNPAGWPEDYSPLLGRDHDEHVYLYAKGRGINDDDIRHYKLGWGRGRNSGRLLIPVLTADGKCDYWQGRDTYEYDDPDVAPPRYLGPRGPYRRWVLFNYHAAQEYESVIIVEGLITAIVAGRNSVATLGKEVTNKQFAQLIAGPWEAFYVCMDGEESELTLALAERIYRAGRIAIPVFLPPDKAHKDAAAIGRARFRQYLRGAVPYSPTEAARLRVGNISH